MTKSLYCSGCGKAQSEVENLIAMAGSVFVCSECVELLDDIEQKRKHGDPVRIKNREMTLSEMRALRDDLSRLRADVDRRLAGIELKLDLYWKGFEP